MEQKLDNILDELDKQLKPHLEFIVNGFERIINDAENLCEKYLPKIKELAETLPNDEKAQEIIEIPFTYSSEGKEAVKHMMGISYNHFNQHLNTTEMPQASIGFCDGYINAYLGTTTQRMPHSQEYKKGIQIGLETAQNTQELLFGDANQMKEKLKVNSWIDNTKTYLHNAFYPKEETKQKTQ